MTITKLLPALAALAFLGACATSTPYQQASNNDRGYNQQQIEQDRWMVSFSGNSLTDRQTVETYLLYRAAELTSQNGYDHFRMVRRATDADSSIVPVGGSSYYDPYYGYFSPRYSFYGPRGRLIGHHHYPSWYRRGFYDPFGGPSAEYREVTRFEATGEIIMGRGPKPDDPAFFNADEVITNLAGRIMRPEA